MTNSTTFPGTVTASGFTGTSTNATNAVLATDATDASRPVIFGTATTGNVPLKTDPGIVYNPSTNKLTAGAFVGDGSELTGISAGFDPDVDTIKIGNGAGAGQGTNAVAIGHDAGSSGQITEAVAIGYEAGFNAQGQAGIAIGKQAGCGDQANDSIAIGTRAGKVSQQNGGVAIGTNAGYNAQGTSTVAIGTNTGYADQGTKAVAMGYTAGQTTQGDNAVAVGNQAGLNAQGYDSVAIGFEAGSNTQGSRAVAIGFTAGCNAQGQFTVAIGLSAGRASQGTFGIGIGYRAGCNAQGTYAVAIGSEAGSADQASESIAIGNQSGKNAQALACIAIGSIAGYTSQGNFGIGIGYAAGYGTQGGDAVAIGRTAGYNAQGTSTVAVGNNAGRAGQGAWSVAIGQYAGYNNQGVNATSIGNSAGYSNQGANAIAIGLSAGDTSQPTNTFRTRLGSVRDANGQEYLHITNQGEIVRGNGYSDDRLKYDEKFITGAVKSLFKLRPQEYLKKPKLIPDPDHDEKWIHESGLMAQEVYYSAPEMRHLVTVADIAGDIDTLTPAPSDDPTQDPDYSVWGDKPSGIKYIQFIPYLIKGIQEIVTELPRSKTTVSNTWEQNITGLVVSAKMNTYKTNVTPIVSLSNVAMDKAWYGVVSDQKTDTNDYDTLVDTNGDTRIWVSDVGGSLESGDLVTTSNIAPGYAQKQSDDIVRNYTVGKVTQECDFTEPLQVSVKIPKKELSNVKYYVKNIIREVQLSEYELYNSRHTTVETKPMYICEVQEGENHDQRYYYRGDVEVSSPSGETNSTKFFLEKTPDEYELLDDEEKAKYTLSTRNIYKVHSQTRSTRLIPEHEEEVFIEEMTDVLDGNGQIVWEETDETEPIYTLVNHGTHKAALLTCKLD